ncbi:FG-GAP-like repeat-containing protein [Streptomyces sp. NPDC007355]|uniref:FG-GAP-like repeat-containing protein n=1 Tax=Streptomyces sp. NPDC007355 TaxID=3364778 RepID=UPI0036A40658
MARTPLPRHRLASAVTVALAVTVGTLAASPALAATSTVTVAAAISQSTQQDVIPFPVGSEIYSAGSTGFLTAVQATSTTRAFSWTRYEGGATTTLTGPHVGGRGTDLVTTRQGTVYTIRDMATDAAPLTVDIAALGSGYSFRGLAGSTLVMVAPGATGGTGLHLVSRPQETLLDREVTGLPADAVITRVDIASPDTAVVLYTGTVDGTSRNRAAVVDVVSGTVREEYDTGTVMRSTPAAVSATHVAWVEDPGTAPRTVTVAVARRDTGTTERVSLPYSDRLAIALVGDWVTYTHLKAVNWYSPAPLRPLTARSLTTGETVTLLEHVTSTATAPDGAQMARGGTLAQGEGLYRIAPGADGTPVATLVASTGEPTALALTGQDVPGVVDLDSNGGVAPLNWTVNQRNVRVALVLTHTATQRRWSLPGAAFMAGPEISVPWDGSLSGGKTAHNGAYTWKLTVSRANGIGEPVTASGAFTVTRKANPHDFDDNGATDLLIHTPYGWLWKDELHRDGTTYGIDEDAGATISQGWGIYDRTEAAGNIGGAPHGDLVARDKAGVLWGFLSYGNGTFAPRVRIGGGWGAYDTIAAGSDLTGDGRPDLVATDTAGTLWLHKGTGVWNAPYAARVALGGGWNIYDRVTAVGDFAGGPAGDLVARDRTGALWSFLGKGDGTFAPRTRVGGGWNAYDHLVGAGDINRDGRPDLVAYGPHGGKTYLGTGGWKAPLSAPQPNTLHEGWGEFKDVA